jgi:DNA-binding transcriptional regulator YhcF (GntR family)
MNQSVIPSTIIGQPTSSATGTASPTFSPLYQQIKALILQSLQSGEWKPGELIPSEVELAVRYKVSQGTVRKAIDELSAARLDESGFTSLRAAVSTRFHTASEYATDMHDLEADLQSLGVSYRIFTSNVILKNAKWSRSQKG